MIMEAEWRIDRSKVLMGFLRIYLDCVVVPILVWATLINYVGIDVIGNTFFAVFLVFGILRIISLLLDPPRYQRLRTSDLRESQ